MTRRQGLSLAAALLIGASVVASAGALAAATPKPVPAKPATAVQLYREYCGQCHALAAALSAGFGSGKNNLGANGGPSFNNLRVPYATSITAIAEPTGGHEIVQTKISWKQLTEVATYLAKVTAGNPIPAFSTDG
jgi:mono/diheme cytochrome c family protein